MFASWMFLMEGGEGGSEKFEVRDDDDVLKFSQAII